MRSLVLLVLLLGVEPRHLVREGELAAVHEGIRVTNPGSVAADVTVSLDRGDQIVDRVMLQVLPGATRLIRMDRLFAVAAGPEDVLRFESSHPVLFSAYDGDAVTHATPSKRRSVRFPSAPLQTQTITLTPSKDNTLYESSNGARSNGVGIHLFAGMTASQEIRRALIAFDVASQIPPGSQVTRVTIKLRVSLTTTGQQPFGLHRVTADWGQGSSNAGASRDGTGTTSRTGDATWVHRFHSTAFWSKQGGDFLPDPDATTEGDFGDIVWESTPALVARVQGWLDQPSTNFGWIVIGNEGDPRTAKRFDSREATAATRPSLTIEYVRR